MGCIAQSCILSEKLELDFKGIKIIFVTIINYEIATQTSNNYT